MRVQIVAEFVRVMDWSPTVWAREICRGLLARGHEVTVIADGVEDARAFEIGGRRARLIVRRPRRIARTRDPRGFQRWAVRTMAATPCDASLSLTRLTPGSLWMPPGPASRDEFAGSVRSPSIVTMALEAAARPWIIEAMRAERRARRMGPAMGAVAREHEPASPLVPLDAESAARSRAAIRSRLGLDDGQVVVLVSVMDAHWTVLEGFLGGLAQLHSASKDRRASAIVLSRESHSIAARAARLGVLSRVRLLSGTGRMPAMFAASDLACVTHSATGSTGRFLADALRCGRPVLGAAGACGSHLLEPGAFGTSPLGLVTGDLTPAGWRRLLDEATEARWLRDATRAARDVGPSLGMDRFLDRLERDLIAAAERG